jgi:hypothetical protein
LGFYHPKNPKKKKKKKKAPDQTHLSGEPKKKNQTHGRRDLPARSRPAVGLAEVLLSLRHEALCRGSLADPHSFSLHPFLSSVAEYIFVGCIFFTLCEVSVYEWWAKNPTFLHRRN